LTAPGQQHLGQVELVLRAQHGGVIAGDLLLLCGGSAGPAGRITDWLSRAYGASASFRARIDRDWALLKVGDPAGQGRRHSTYLSLTAWREPVRLFAAERIVSACSPTSVSSLAIFRIAAICPLIVRANRGEMSGLGADRGRIPGDRVRVEAERLPLLAQRSSHR